ncbi:MAG: hypothetical protein AAF939_01350 [Planctomycetota bacterium]
MTGHLEGTLNGRPVKIVANGKQIEVQLSSMVSAWQARKVASIPITQTIELFQKFSIGLSVSVSGFQFGILPKPSRFLQLFSPKIYQTIVKSSN